jgi:hypothetical protein
MYFKLKNLLTAFLSKKKTNNHINTIIIRGKN